MELRKEWRIVQAARHVVGRFTYYRTEFHEAQAVYLAPPHRRFPTHMRWNLDEAGEPQLEMVFRHKGRTARLDSWPGGAVL